MLEQVKNDLSLSLTHTVSIQKGGKGPEIVNSLPFELSSSLLHTRELSSSLSFSKVDFLAKFPLSPPPSFL